MIKRPRWGVTVGAIGLLTAVTLALLSRTGSVAEFSSDPFVESQPTISPGSSPAPYQPEVELTPAPTVFWVPPKAADIDLNATPSPPPFVKELGCREDNGAPSAGINLPPLSNLAIHDVQFFSDISKAAVRLDWDSPKEPYGCYIYEISNDQEVELVRSLNTDPVFDVPGRYCFRVIVGNATGRSDWSNKTCADLSKVTEADCLKEGDFASCDVTSETVANNDLVPTTASAGQ